MPLAAAIAAGLVSAVFYLSVLTGSAGSLILVYLVQLPLFGAGLSLGVKAALIAGATASLATAAVGGWALGGLFLLAEVLPVLFLVHQALRWHKDRERVAWTSPGRLVMALVALAGALLLGVMAALAGETGGMRGTIEAFLTRQIAAIMEFGAQFPNVALEGPSGPVSASAVASAITPFFPALAVGSWLLMIVINGVLAQGALIPFGLNRRPAPDMAELTLPRWLVAALAAATALALLVPGDLGYVAASFVPIICLAYALAGLGVLHAFVRRSRARLFILIPAYVVLPVGWPVLLFSCCGIIDQWFGLRRRFAAASTGQGEV